MGLKIELYNDHFENAKRYGIPHAQLIIADIPYNLGNNAYASNPMWYVGGDNKNGESDKANKTFFDTDKDFKINNFFDFCTRYLKKETKEKGQAPAMVVFCAFEQIQSVIDEGKKHMIFNWFEWKRDNSKQYPKIHPTQKPVGLLKRIIEIFTDEGDVVIDPVAGSGSTLRACAEMNRNCYGFEIKKQFYNLAQEKMLKEVQLQINLKGENNAKKD